MFNPLVIIPKIMIIPVSYPLVVVLKMKALAKFYISKNIALRIDYYHALTHTNTPIT